MPKKSNEYAIQVGDTHVYVDLPRDYELNAYVGEDSVITAEVSIPGGYVTLEFEDEVRIYGGKKHHCLFDSRDPQWEGRR